MKKTLFIVTMAAGILAVSCDSLGGGKNDDATPLTPEENRAKLEEIGLEAINMASPDKQADLLQVIDKFAEYVGEYNLKFDYNDDPSYRKLSPVMPVDALLKPVQAFCKTGNPYNLTKAVTEDSYVYEAGRAYGIYEFTGKGWKYEDSADRLSFIFPCDGQEAVATVMCSGQEYRYEYQYEWSDWKGSYEGDEFIYEEVEHREIYDITVPAKVRATVTLDGRTLLDVEINGSYEEGSAVSQTLSLTAGGYDVAMTLDIDNSSISQKLTFNIDGTSFITSDVTAKGTGLCSVESYENNIEEMFSSAEVTATLLDLEIHAVSGSNISIFIDELQALEEKADNNWTDNREILEPDTNMPYWGSEKYNQEYCALINDAIAITASYSGHKPFADLKLKAMFTDNLHFSDWYYTERGYYTTQWRTFSGYEPTAIIKFRNDGAEFDITDYFSEEQFSTVIDASETLSERYENYMRYIFS